MDQGDGGSWAVEMDEDVLGTALYGGARAGDEVCQGLFWHWPAKVVAPQFQGAEATADQVGLGAAANGLDFW
tara:strand:+ start:35326 stop:35541 length:216 start_codon:yes stop_codon:yes gene_type:complete